ncbi:hypothetical protein PoB_000192100 [Plakobranchus ocellatus]|uniref:Uncharacterized protein n=1 Tax=Plakobranchus ocellatus TaxID=259542 RepID=A0AAV3XZD7_9GAST|nr:hypothetical protein PoB_000192100 [Plakobranchus ocellatus]
MANKWSAPAAGGDEDGQSGHRFIKLYGPRRGETRQDWGKSDIWCMQKVEKKEGQNRGGRQVAGMSPGKRDEMRRDETEEMYPKKIKKKVI